MSSHTILCGNCGTPLEGPEDARPEDEVACSKCGQSDTLADVIESAQNFVTDETAKQLNATMADAVKGSKYITFRPSQFPKQRYRWTVADLKL